nr:MAG TPA: hypothetical protein [Caudoviricetes sp.]
MHTTLERTKMIFKIIEEEKMILLILLLAEWALL